MSSRKPRVEVTLPSAQAKAVPYPPASIWKTKEEGVGFDFRGNVFARCGNHVARVFNADKPGTSSAPASKPRSE